MPRRPADQESESWRRKNRDTIIREINPFLERVRRRSGSQNSVDSKVGAILNFCSWQQKLPSEIIAGVKSGKTDPYQLLDDFAGHLTKLNLSPFAIKNSVSGARRLLVVYGKVSISSDEFKERVALPRIRARTHDEPLTADKVKRIFIHMVNPTGKRLVAVLVSTGCRIMEALPTRYSEIDFEAKPARIFLPESRTKDRLARYVWLTSEVVELIKEAGLKDGDYLFPSGANGKGRWKGHGYMSYSNADYILKVALKRAGLYKTDEYGRSLITLHSFRKYTYSRLSPVVGKENGQAILGHSEYLDQSYWRKTPDDMGKIFAKGEQAVTVMAAAPIVSEEELEERVNERVNAGILRFFGMEPTDIGDTQLPDMNFEDLSKRVTSIKKGEYHITDRGRETLNRLINSGREKDLDADAFDVVEVQESDRKRIAGLLAKGFEPVENADFDGSTFYKRKKK